MEHECGGEIMDNSKNCFGRIKGAICRDCGLLWECMIEVRLRQLGVKPTKIVNGVVK